MPVNYLRPIYNIFYQKNWKDSIHEYKDVIPNIIKIFHDPSEFFHVVVDSIISVTDNPTENFDMIVCSPFKTDLEENQRYDAAICINNCWLEFPYTIGMHLAEILLKVKEESNVSKKEVMKLILERDDSHISADNSFNEDLREIRFKFLDKIEKKMETIDSKLKEMVNPCVEMFPFYLQLDSNLSFAPVYSSFNWEDLTISQE